MTTSDRVLSVLSLFTLERPEWTVEEASQELDLTLSTGYRYFRSLTSAGLLIALATGRYSLGPAIIQYDRQLRLHDPLIRLAQPVMRRITEQLQAQSVALLCRLFRNQVMCVHQEFSAKPRFAVSYERGRPMPLFRGAASKAILAHMPLRVVKSLYEAHAGEFAQAGLGRRWDEVRVSLRTLRTVGVAVTKEEIDVGICGVAAPIFEGDNVVIGSLGLVVAIRGLNVNLLQEMSDLLSRASQKISTSISQGATRAAVTARTSRGRRLR